MTNTTDWLTSSIMNTRQQGAEVPSVVAARIEELLRGKLSQRPLPAMELGGIARDLIELMIPAPPKLEEQK